MDRREISSGRYASPHGFAARQEKGARISGMLALALLAITLLVLSACVAMSEKQCLSADWYSVGVEDGSKGYPMSRIGAYRKDCAEVGVAPDADQYGQGRMVGLDSFCTYDRGYTEGKRGARNPGVCPAGQLAADFAQGYNDGHYVYEVNQNIRSLERDLAEVRREVDEIRTDLDNGYWVDSAGISHEIGDYERGAKTERLIALSKEEGRLESEIAGLRQSIAGS